MSISQPVSNSKRPPDRDSAGRPSGIGRGARQLFSLGSRLALCASMVRQGAALADIGTDHAYLPVWLAKKNRIRSAVASDIRPGPLHRARDNIERYGVSDLVSARLSDGLEEIEPEEAEDVVIAGMGGLMMIHIIQAAPWLKDPNRRLILQPMTSVKELRGFLVREGFCVLQEKAAVEDSHVYSVMQVNFTGRKQSVSELFYYIGRMTAETPEERTYLAVQKRRLEKKSRGLLKAGETLESNRYALLASQIEKML